MKKSKTIRGSFSKLITNSFCVGDGKSKDIVIPDTYFDESLEKSHEIIDMSTAAVMDQSLSRLSHANVIIITLFKFVNCELL